MAAKKSKTKQGVSKNSKERILLTALKLFSEQGFKESSIRAIAKEAGLAYSLIRRHYGSKDGLIEAVDEFVIEKMTAPLDIPEDVQASELLHLTNEQSMARIAEYPELLKYFRRALLEQNDRSFSLFEHYFDMHLKGVERYKKKGALREGTDKFWLACTLMFLQLGPVLLAPYLEPKIGKSIYARSVHQRRNRAYVSILEPTFTSD